jgi:tetratricopeptide (TPR) repeat protein
VCSFEPLEPERIPVLMTSLVNKSLVTVEFSNEEARYCFLETIRAYTREQLAASRDSETIARRHAEWSADYGEWLAEQIFYADGAWWQRVYGETLYEAANRKEALEWALGARETLLAGRIAGSPIWAASSPHAQHLIEATLARITETEYRSVEARLWLELSRGTHGKGRLDAARRAVAIFGELGERNHWLGNALFWMQRACNFISRPEEALAASDQLLALLHDLAATGLEIYAKVMTLRGASLTCLGRYEESRQCHIEAMGLSIARTQRLGVMVELAELEFDMGNVRQAAAIAEEVAAAVPRSEWTRLFSTDLNTMAVSRANAAAYRLMLGEIDEARLAALDGLELARRGRLAPPNLPTATQHLATVAALLGDAGRAARLRGYVDAWYAATGDIRFPTEQRTYELLVAALKERLSETEMQRLSAEGASLDEEEAVAMALAIGQTPFI